MSETITHRYEIEPRFVCSLYPPWRNAVCVQALTEGQVELAVDTLKQCAPLQVGVASPSADPDAMTIALR